MRIYCCLLFLFISSVCSGQQTVHHEHCDCTDTIDQIEPELNGDFQRKCGNQVVIKGQFVDGRKEGTWFTKTKRGTTIRKLHYKNGRLDKSVELFFYSGEKKLIGNFEEGLKVGEWLYFNEKGKVIKKGKFEKGKPVGVWKVYDAKGKKELVVYDFDKRRFLKNKNQKSTMRNGAILQNDNSEEWFIRQTSEEDHNIYNSMPFEGTVLAEDLHIQFMEIPLEMWEAYVSYNISADLVFEDGALLSIHAILGTEHLEDVPQIGFFAITNDKDKLFDVEQPALSIKLLLHNIEEAVWLMGPWITSEVNTTIYVPFVINDIKNRR